MDKNGNIYLVKNHKISDPYSVQDHFLSGEFLGKILIKKFKANIDDFEILSENQKIDNLILISAE